MTWFKVDDSFAQHPKVLAIPRRDRAAAIGLWTLAGTWCASQLTDGRLARGLLAEFACTSRQAQVLVEAGLWETTEDGYQFHDWASWQPTKQQVEGERAAAKERMQRVREARRSPRGSAEQPPNDERTSPEVRLTPTRPDPTSTSNEVRRAATPLRAVGPDENAGQVMALWLESLTRRPPSAVVGQIAKQVKSLLADKFTPQEIIDGLNAWQAKGLHPSTLPSVVNETINKPKRPAYTDEVIQPRSAFSAVVDS